MLTSCFPCRSWLSWCPRLRTLLLDLLLIYLSVPFLIRLFPVLLTKFVFLNFCKLSQLGEPPTRDSATQGVGTGSPKRGRGRTWYLGGSRTAPSQPPWLAEEAQRDLSAPRVLQAVIMLCC